MIFNTHLKNKIGERIEEEKKYSGTSRYGHVSITDSSHCLDKIVIYFL